MKRLYPWVAVLISVMFCGLWFSGCSQQEGPAEKAGKEIDQTIEEVADTMEDTKESIVEAAKDLADDVKDATQEE